MRLWLKSALRCGAFIPLGNSNISIFYTYDFLGSGYGYFSRRAVFFNTIHPIVYAEYDNI